MPVDPKQDVDAFCQKWRGVEPFALATVVKTRRLTSAKAGAKAVVTAQGRMLGWVGGGCVQGAVKKVAAEVMKSGRPRLIRVKPRDEVIDTSDVDGVELHKSGCPSKGVADLFIEPILPKPALVIFGASPVAEALAQYGSLAGYRVARAVRKRGDLVSRELDMVFENFDLAKFEPAGQSFLIIATQGAGDFDALKAALDVKATYTALVGSRKKLEALQSRLIESGCSPASIERIKAPAGLDIGAGDASEIAISIMAEIVQIRRASPDMMPSSGQRLTESGQKD